MVFIDNLIWVENVRKDFLTSFEKRGLKASISLVKNMMANCQIVANDINKKPKIDLEKIRNLELYFLKGSELLSIFNNNPDLNKNEISELIDIYLLNDDFYFEEVFTYSSRSTIN